MVSHVWRGRARAALGLCAAAGLLASLSGCASAAAAPERSARAADGGAEEPAPVTPLARPSDPWTERAEGREGARPGDEGQVRLDLPPARPTALPVDERPLLPERARLALVCAQDARLVRPAQALLDLGRELDDPRLAPVVGLGALPAGVTRVDLAALADEADAQGFDLLLVDVRQGAARDGLLLHAVTGAVLGVFEVRPGGLTTSAGRAAVTGDDLVARVGAAWARTR